MNSLLIDYFVTYISTIVVTKNNTERTTVTLERKAAFVRPVFLLKKESPVSAAEPTMPFMPGSLPSWKRTTATNNTHTIICKTVNNVLMNKPPIHSNNKHTLVLYHKFFNLQDVF